MNFKSLYRVAVVLLALLLVVSLVVPEKTLDWIREEITWLGKFINWLEAISPSVDMSHIVAFGLVGAALRPALGRGHIRAVAIGFAVFSVTSELVQFWVPGRTPRLGDAFVDIAGALAGYAAMSLLCAAGRGVRPPP